MVGIFPNRPAVLRLVGALLAEQRGEWAISRRYLAMEGLAEALAVTATKDEVPPQLADWLSQPRG